MCIFGALGLKHGASCRGDGGLCAKKDEKRRRAGRLLDGVWVKIYGIYFEIFGIYFEMCLMSFLVSPWCVGGCGSRRAVGARKRSTRDCQYNSTRHPKNRTIVVGRVVGALPVELVGHGVVAVASPGVAAQYAAQSEVGALHDSVALDGFERILAACWGEAACGRGEWRDAPLIEAYGGDGYFAQDAHVSGG